MDPTRTQPARSPRRSLRRIARALIALACVCVSPAIAQVDGSTPDDGEFIESRPFSIPDKQSAKALYDLAAAHVRAGRWTEGVTALERLIVEHSGSVLALPSDSAVSQRSVQPVFRGAADAAREMFASLPPAAHAAYSDRYLALTQGLLARALSAKDGPALAELARRYPLTRAARDAWWALGDLEAEAGNSVAAKAAWARAANWLTDRDAAAQLALRSAWTPGESAERSARASF
jgi:hypothetical protein